VEAGFRQDVEENYVFFSSFSTSIVHSVTSAAKAPRAARSGAQIMPAATTGAPTERRISKTTLS